MATKRKPPKRFDTDYLVLHTGQAKRLIKGRESNIEKGVHPIHGFELFTKAIRPVWDAAAYEDPYALWYLQRISEKLNQAETFLEKLEKTAKDKFEDGLEVDYRLFTAGREQKYPLNLKPPYSWALARLIKRYDDHCLVLLKLNSIGLMKDREIRKESEKISRMILSTINEVISYRDLHITMQDIDEETEAFEKAGEIMGIIPPKVLSGELKADFIPPVKKGKSRVENFNK
jgi:integrating conjugative element protein (TIGR03761 family)